jgi:diguanylate cyclase (GGDEF)-like protein/PAS domain S-box-containing protein
MRGRQSEAKGGARRKAAVDGGRAPDPAPVSLLEVVADYYWEQDSSHRFTVWRQTSTCAGVAAAVDGASWLGKTSAELCAPPANDPDQWLHHRARLDAREPFRDVVHTLPGPIGPHHVSLSGAPAFDSQRGFVGYRGVARDISALVRQSEARSAALEQLRDSEARFASTMALAAIGISHVDDDGRFLYVNPQLCAMLGYSEPDLLALSVKDLTHPDDADVTTEPSRQLREGRVQSFKAEKRYVRKDGSTIWVGLTVALKRDRNGAKLYDVSVVEDISARKEAERRVQYLASHDTLTDLPNRATFAQLLARASETARRCGTRLAVLFIDLDRFKIVNDTLGHEAGDELLRTAATRLRSSVRASDVVARLGGDEFVVLLQDVPNQAVAAKVASGILAALRPPVVIRSNECALRASIGICLHPDGDQEDQAVLRNADMAMYLAKQSGKNGYRFYIDELGVVAAERAAIETRLRSAWERGEYTLRYDATVDTASGSVVGLVARVRWTSAELASAAADKVASVAQEAGLVMRVNQWALHTACAATAAWQRAGLAPVGVAVAVSEAQLRDPRFAASVRDTLEQVGLEPRWLELDIGEEVLCGHAERVTCALEALTSLGVQVAIDAYGSGRSSLADLKRYPIGAIKLHTTRVEGVAADPDKQRYFEGLVALAAALDFTVVATGVANEADAAYLRRSGCAAWQGPFGPSELAAADCEKLLAARASSP